MCLCNNSFQLSITVCQTNVFNFLIAAHICVNFEILFGAFTNVRESICINKLAKTVQSSHLSFYKQDDKYDSITKSSGTIPRNVILAS